MDVVVTARVGRRAVAFLVAEAGVEAGCLEGMGTQGHLAAATAPDLLLPRGQEPGAQAGSAMVFLHPEKVDVATSTPRPPDARCMQMRKSLLRLRYQSRAYGRPCSEDVI